MVDRPIIFSAPMVRALLAGRKTQTRRVLKPQPESKWQLDPRRAMAAAEGCFWFTDDPEFPGNRLIRARFAPGDRLWVRENFSVKRHEPCLDHERDWQSLSSPVIRYTADGAERPPSRGDKKTGFGIYHGSVEKGLPSIHMPRWASRLTLLVEAVRVERLQDISEEDARAEGAARMVMDDDQRFYENSHSGTHRCGFAGIWSHIHGLDAWDANPWVVAVTFSVVKANIDNVHYTSAETLRAVLDPTAGSGTFLSAAATADATLATRRERSE